MQKIITTLYASYLLCGYVFWTRSPCTHPRHFHAQSSVAHRINAICTWKQVKESLKSVRSSTKNAVDDECPGATKQIGRSFCALCWAKSKQRSSSIKLVPNEFYIHSALPRIRPLPEFAYALMVCVFRMEQVCIRPKLLLSTLLHWHRGNFFEIDFLNPFRSVSILPLPLQYVCLEKLIALVKSWH